MPTPTYTPLATVTLGSSAASVTFSSIPAIYRDLILIVNGSSTTSQANLAIRYNSDSGSNYSYVEMYGNGSSAVSTSSTLSYAYSGNLFTNLVMGVVQVMDYSATDKHKTLLSRSSAPSNQVAAIASRWANTAAITSLQVLALDSTNNFASGSTFSLYGVIA
jgi:hypothetical protein